MIAIAGRPTLEGVAAAAEERRRALVERMSAARPELALHELYQVAHYFVPADDAVRARKALAAGTSPMERLLERHAISPTELADRLGVDSRDVEGLLHGPRPAPVVVFDGEDAAAPGSRAAEAGLANVVELLREPPAAARPRPSLCLFRPPPPSDPAGVPMILRLLDRLADWPRASNERLPLAGFVLPKLRLADEVAIVDEALSGAEAELGLPNASVRLILLVETGWAVAHLDELVECARRRLLALVYGPVDHAADVGLATLDSGQPVNAAARAAIVELAGAAGVPAIDGMTMAYPVANPSLDAAANRDRFLERVELAYRDARSAAAMGMAGKLVGHPAQLFAVLLAFEEELDGRRTAVLAERLERYREALAGGQAVAIIDGEMADRATARHARAVLRRAVAAGGFDPRRALELGVIEPSELDEASALQAVGGVAPGVEAD